MALGVGDREWVGRLRGAKYQGIGEGQVILQRRSGHRIVEEVFGHLDRYLMGGASELAPCPVAVVGLLGSGLENGASRVPDADDTSAAAGQPQQNAIAGLHLSEVPFDSPALKQISIGQVVVDTPLFWIALKQPVRHASPLSLRSSSIRGRSPSRGSGGSNATRNTQPAPHRTIRTPSPPRVRGRSSRRPLCVSHSRTLTTSRANPRCERGRAASRWCESSQLRPTATRLAARRDYCPNRVAMRLAHPLGTR
jgi:hypothetical protein